MLNRSTLMILVLVVVFAVCGLSESVDPLYIDNNTASNASSGRLNETEWVLTSLNGNSLVENSTITLAFTCENDISGCIGCNNYGGRYTINGNDFNIFVQGRTDFDCDVPESIMQQEATYLKLLASAAAYLVMDDRLEIDNAAGETILVFTLREELLMDPSALEGIEWQLISWNGRSPHKDSNITIAFAAGEISGHAGYRDYAGTYEASGDDIRFTSIGMKEPTSLKPEALRFQESGYTTNLSLATNYRLSEGELEIFTAPGGVLIYDPVSEKKTSGFEAVSVVVGFITVTYLLRKRK